MNHDHAFLWMVMLSALSPRHGAPSTVEFIALNCRQVFPIPVTLMDLHKKQKGNSHTLTFVAVALCRHSAMRSGRSPALPYPHRREALDNDSGIL
jgi:hypothetical protein